LKYQSLVYRILDNLSASDVNTACYKDAKRAIEGINQKETWAVKVLDGSGDLEPGFLLGNTHWLGSKTTCDSINTPYKVTLSDRYERNTVSDLFLATAPIGFQFRMVHARHVSPWQAEMKFFDEVSTIS
jgi:Nose resistant-to-fluoxetine protein, N-terminal domain